MKFLNRSKGSNLVEYIIPLAVIALVVGGGLYMILENGNILNFLTRSAGGTYGENKSKIIIGMNSSSGGIIAGEHGVYESPDGKIYLTNNYGQSVPIPKSFYEKYAAQIEKYLKKGKFDFKPINLIGEETTGGVGIEQLTEDQNVALRIYGTLLKLAAKNADNEHTKNMLSSIAKQGLKLGNQEKKLEKIKATLDKYENDHEKLKNGYVKAKEAYLTTLESYRNGNPNNITTTQLSKLYNSVVKSYNKYSKLEKDYEKASASLSQVTQQTFEDIKNVTGMKFDAVVENLINDPKIDQDTKDMVVPIGNRISMLKNSIEILEKTVDTLTATFNDNMESFIDEADQFQTIAITMDPGAGDETIELSESLPGEDFDDCYDENLNYICDEPDEPDNEEDDIGD